VTNALIHACAKAADHGRALEVYEQALAEGVEPDSSTINSLIHACAQAGDPQVSHSVEPPCGVQLVRARVWVRVRVRFDVRARVLLGS
jgi:pentatricopeptide repeat protein